MIDEQSQVAGQLSGGVSKVWVAKYKVKSQHDIISGLVIDGHNNIYVAGTIQGSSLDYLILKYDPSGKLLWTKKWDGANYDDSISHIAVDAQGNLYVNGTSYGGNSKDDIVTIKYDSDGNPKWVARYNDSESEYDWAGGVAVDRSGNVYVTGSSESSKLGRQMVTIKYNSSGGMVWTKLFDLYTDGILTSYDDRGFRIALDKAGNVCVTGTNGLGIDDIITVKYSPSGSRKWVAKYGGAGDDRPRAIVADAAGNVTVSGDSGGAGQDIVTIKYSSGGAQKWAKRYTGTGNNYDGVGGMSLDAAGNTLVTGYASRETRGYVTMKYDPAGQQKWIQFYEGKNHNGAVGDSLAVDSSGNVYVTGTSNSSVDTIKYDPSGEPSWSTTYSMTTYDKVRIAVDSSQNVILAAKRSDVYWEIIKYSQVP